MALKMVPLAFFSVIVLLAKDVADATIGINWGRQNAQRLMPSNVVDLLLQNGIREARIFSSEEDILRAFTGSGIGLTVTLSNPSDINSYQECHTWVEARQKYFIPSNIKQLNIADFAFVTGLVNRMFLNEAMKSFKNMQKALNDAGYGEQVKVTIPHHDGVLKINGTSLRPSEAEFRDEIRLEMAAFLRILALNKSPFVVNISPIILIAEHGVDINFGIPDNSSTFTIKDVNGAVYTNAVELIYDSYIWALIKLNASDTRVVVGQVGWPTDGYPGANATMAERFFKALLPWVSGTRGTPMRPGAPIDIFIHALTDENKIFYFKSAFFTRHSGIYRSNGKPKFKIDLSGRGRDVYPADAKGIMRMPERWCLFNGNRSDILKVKRQFKRACSRADCTTLYPGGSCSHLGFDQNVSYAFNMHFQFQYQNESECDFEGLGYVAVEDPSTPECVFPVEVVRTQQPSGAVRNGVHQRPAIFVVLLSVLGALFWK